MIELVKDEKNKGYIIPYVNYMLAASRRYVDSHKSFDRYEFYIYDGGNIHGYEKVDILNERMEILSRFNSMLELHGLPVSAAGFESYTCYLGIKNSKKNDNAGWYGDYLCLKESARKFALEYGVLLLVAAHFFEIGDSEDSMKIPHVHILYAKPEFEKDCFARWFVKVSGR